MDTVILNAGMRGYCERTLNGSGVSEPFLGSASSRSPSRPRPARPGPRVAQAGRRAPDAARASAESRPQRPPVRPLTACTTLHTNCRLSDGQPFHCLIVGYNTTRFVARVALFVACGWSVRDVDAWRVAYGAACCVPVPSTGDLRLRRWRLQSSRARSSVKDDKDGHLVYWPGYVMGARCSCPQHNLTNRINKNTTLTRYIIKTHSS